MLTVSRDVKPAEKGWKSREKSPTVCGRSGTIAMVPDS